jgi:hypothetical protein
MKNLGRDIMSTTCNNCGTEFDGNFCPKCGNPNFAGQPNQTNTPVNPMPPYQPNMGQPIQPPVKKKHGCLTAILIAIGVLMLFAVINSIVNKDKPKVVGTDDAAGNVSSTPLAEKTTFGIGETVELKDILVTLVGVTISDGGDFNKPSDGNVFLLCEFNIENNSDKDITVSSIISFEAYCDDYSINQSITALLEKGDKNQLDGTVAAGKKMNGVIGYEVSKDWKELEVNFTPDFWSGKAITFIAENE